MKDSDLGTYVFSTPMEPFFWTSGILILPNFTPLVSKFGPIAQQVQLVTLPMVGTAMAAALTFQMRQDLLSRRPHMMAANRRRRHNRALCVGAAGMAGLETYAYVCQPVPEAHVGKDHVTGAFMGAALAVGLLWAKRPKRLQRHTRPAQIPVQN